MALPSSPNSITMLQIRNEFAGQGSPNPSSYSSSNTDLMNLNYYRGKYYLDGYTYVQFSSNSINMDTFRGKAANCACDCACFCSGGDGEGGG